MIIINFHKVLHDEKIVFDNKFEIIVDVWLWTGSECDLTKVIFLLFGNHFTFDLDHNKYEEIN